MGKTEMTIHRALSELKLIDARIEKGIEKFAPVGFHVEGKKINNFIDKDKFEKDAKSNFESITDLIARKSLIKSAIVTANSKTKIEVAGKEMTIADAINQKGTIEYKRKLIKKLETEYKHVTAEVNKANDTVERNALIIAQSALQKDNIKIGDEDAVAITQPYIKKNTVHLIDPVEVLDKIKEMTEEVDEFEAEVDAVLSEINAITKIKV